MENLTLEQKVKNHYSKLEIPNIDVKNSVFNELTSTKINSLSKKIKLTVIITFIVTIIGSSALAASQKLLFFNSKGNLAWKTDLTLGKDKEDIHYQKLYSKLNFLLIDEGEAVIGHLKVDGYDEGIIGTKFEPVTSYRMDNAIELIGEEYDLKSLIDLITPKFDFIKTEIEYNSYNNNRVKAEKKLIKDAYSDSNEFHYVILKKDKLDIHRTKIVFKDSKDLQIEIDSPSKNMPISGISNNNSDTTYEKVMLDNVEAIYLQPPVGAKTITWFLMSNDYNQMIALHSYALEKNELIEIAQNIDKNYKIK